MLISIIIPCYNQGHFLEDTLQSVFSQSYTNWQCIIVNDGSTDATEKIAKQWLEKDKRFQYILKENGGLSSARNAGLEISKGAYVQFLDSDDILRKNKLQQSIELAKSKKSNLIITNFLMFEKSVTATAKAYCALEQQVFDLISIVRDWDRIYTIPIHCGFFSADFFENIRFNEALKAKEDWLMWIEVFKLNPTVSFINQPLVLYRKNPKGMTSNYEHMRTNLVRSYEVIFAIIPEDLKPVFLKKVVSDSSATIHYFRKKFLKYKKDTKLLMVLSAVLLVVIVLILLIS